MLEKLIAKHCGPALAGIKPANLISCSKDKYPNINGEIERLNGELNCTGIFFKVLCECEKNLLLLVYREDKLFMQLKKPEISSFLDDYGYENLSKLDEYISKLKERLSLNRFPHEIGAFLGYPIHDIYGFIHHKNEDCLLIGDWRVYKDEERAKRTFKRYRILRCAILKRMSKGQTLAQIFCAA